ncbi:MAG: 2-dehydropantoate 2-reductase [Frankiales bacterium]|nr:2-dehydropantoate 2-reductase [Frankiales bacterium]
MDAMRVAVLGPGGIGGMLGALLAREGHAVTCLARPGTAEHIDRHGLSLSSDRFGEVQAPARGVERLDEPVDACLVATKASHLDDALDRVPPELLGDALLVPLLNGVEHMALLRERFPRARSVAGAIRVVASRSAPGVARQEGQMAALELGPGADELADALRATGLDVAVRPDEASLLWGKLCFLAPVALLTTRHMAALGPVRQEHGDDLAAVVREVAAVARAEGADADPEATLAFVGTVPDAMRSSMQRDAEEGNPTELEAIGGAVLRAAARRGIAVPVTERIVEELRTRLR